jgi:hypothetical protein
VHFAQPVWTAVRLPEDPAGLDVPDRHNPFEVATLATDLEMCVVGDPLVMERMATPASHNLLAGMGIVGGPQVADRAGKLAMRRGRIFCHIQKRKPHRGFGQGSDRRPAMTVKAEVSHPVPGLRIIGPDEAVAVHAESVLGRRFRQGRPQFMAPGAFLDAWLRRSGLGARGLGRLFVVGVVAARAVSGFPAVLDLRATMLAFVDLIQDIRMAVRTRSRT